MCWPQIGETWKRTKQYDSIAIGAVNVCVCCAVCCIVLYSLKLSSLAVASLCLCSPLRQLVILWSLLNEGIVMRHMLRSGDYITEHNNRRIIHALYLCLSMQIMNCEFPKAKHWNTTQQTKNRFNARFYIEKWKNSLEYSYQHWFESN